MKIKAFLVSFILLMISTSAFAADTAVTFGDGRVLNLNRDVWCTADGRYVDFNSNGVPFMAYTETMDEGAVNYIPIRTVAEALGLIVGYNDETATIELKSADKVLLLKVNSPYATLKDSAYNHISDITLTASASVSTPCSVRNINDTTYIPIRAVTESFGFLVGWNNGQIILATNETNLVPCDKNTVSTAIKVYGRQSEIRLANGYISQGFEVFKEKNNLSDLTGMLCRTKAEKMWIVGIPESRLEYYDAVIPKEYFDCTYYKTSAASPWIEYIDDVPIRSIYDISTDMTTISGAKNINYTTTSEISDTNLRGAMEYFHSIYGHSPKIDLEEYPASFDSLATGMTEDATLYKLTLPYDRKKVMYVLRTPSGYSEIAESLIPATSLTQNITISLPKMGNLRIFCDIIIVDIIDA